MHSRLLLSIALLGLAVVAVAGCGGSSGGSSDQPTAVTAGNEKIEGTLSFWYVPTDPSVGEWWEGFATDFEAEHPGVKGRLRGWIHRADADDPNFHWLRLCVLRIGRSTLIDEVRFRDELYQRTARPPAPSRRRDREAAT